MTKKRYRRRKTSHSNAIPVLILIVLLAAVTLLALLVFGKLGDGEVGDNPSFFSRLFGKSEAEEGDSTGLLDGLFGKETPTPAPTATPEPTPTPVPEFSPYSVTGTRPEDFGIETAVEVDGIAVSDYSASEKIDFLEGENYTEAKGIITFRGNNFRDGASYGTTKLVQKKINTDPWTFSVGSLPKMYGEGAWSGTGWTGQPLIVQWPESTKAVMNLYDSAKAKADLVEVIYATMDGHIYFLDLATGQKTRDPINLGHPFKGAGALDPRGYPLMYLGSGDDSPTEGSGSAHAFIVSLIDGSILYEFGQKDPFTLRDWTAYDSSPLVDAETDTLIYPGENGILYMLKLNTQYDPAAGTISVSPSPVVKWRYTSTRSNSTAVDGSSGWWLGIEDSAIIWRSHAIFTDNGGLMMCLDLNTLTVVWAQDTLDDTNCTPVLELEGEDHHPYIYTSTSFHAGWRKKETDKASIPIWKVDAVTGERVWTNTDYSCQTISGVSGGVQGTLVVGKNALSNLIFVPVAMTDGSKGKLVALSKADGHMVWECDFAGYPWSSPVAVYDEDGNGYLIQCNQTGYIHLIDGLTGTILDEMSLGSNVEASPAVFGNTVVVGTRGGLIYGITLE